MKKQNSPFRGENSDRTSMDQEQLIDQTDQNENDTNSDNDSHDFIPRRSNSIGKKRKIFTYHQFGKKNSFS